MPYPAHIKCAARAGKLITGVTPELLKLLDSIAKENGITTKRLYQKLRIEVEDVCLGRPMGCKDQKIRKHRRNTWTRKRPPFSPINIQIIGFSNGPLYD